MAICPTTGQLYVNDFNWPNPGGFDHRLWVFDPDGNGTPASILFTGQSSKAPGGIVDGPLLFEFHPTTGALYVLDEGWYVDEGDSTWVSRIQRFSPNGSYDGFKIDNSLGHPPDPMFELPDCGVWRFPRRFFIDEGEEKRDGA